MKSDKNLWEQSLSSTTWVPGIELGLPWWQPPLPVESCPSPVVSFDGGVGSGFTNDDEAAAFHEKKKKNILGVVVSGENVGGDGDAVGTS